MAEVGWDVISRSKPSIKQLQNIVVPKVASKWHELGIELYRDSDVPKLDTFHRNSPGDYTKGCTEMFKYWLGSYGNATWDRLIKALTAPGLQLNAIAGDVKKEVIKDRAEKGDCDDSGVSQSDTAAAAAAEDILLTTKPRMWDLISIVTPKVKASWGSLAYSMGYDIEDVKAWETDYKESSERCRRLFESWLSGGDGRTPKTWGKLLERIKAVNELNAAADEIKEELLSGQKK